MYQVFIRNWWKWEVKSGQKTKVPDPRARKTHYAYVSTEDEAREIAQKYNATHNAGALSRKAEFQRV